MQEEIMTNKVFSTQDGAISPDALVKRLKALPDQFKNKNGGLLRQIMFQVAKEPELKAKEIVPVKTGRLKNAIRKRRDRSPQLEGATENYQVFVKTGRKRDDVNGAFYWSWVHFGSIHNIGYPFLTIAFESTRNQMLRKFETEFPRKLELAEKKVKKIK